MADEHNFPTAIVPTRPGTAIERYDKLAEQFADPMVTLFMMQDPVLGSPDDEVRLRAAAELMPYRYPKLKLTEIRGAGGPGGPGGFTININIGAGEKPAIDITPEVDPLS
jgi:hypothetical protein